MIAVYRAIKKWNEMSTEEMLHALRNQHYYDPKKNDHPFDSGAIYGNLDRGVHKGEVHIKSADYNMIRLYREEEYRKKCKEKGITPAKLPEWA